MPKTIMHIDMNSYFATVEQQANPRLRGRPVGIIKAPGRGCVIAASVEAKRFGVKTGCGVGEAKRLCPWIELVPADMDKYLSLTNRMYELLGEYAARKEIFSIDELFLDVSEEQKLWSGGVWEMALDMKARIRLELGEWVSCSVGVGPTKIIAKLASEMRKPDGLVCLDADNYLQKTEEVKAEEVCGIGGSRSRYLRERGLVTLGQARQASGLPEEICDLVWLRPDEDLVLDEDLQPAKSVSRTYTTYEALNNQDAILKLVRNLTEEACAKLREMEMAGRTFVLQLSVGNVQFSARKTVVYPTSDPLVVYNLLIGEYLKNPLVGVRQAGVWISNLVFSYQLPVFSYRKDLFGAVDEVNRKFGLFTVYPASLMGKELVRPEATGFLGDKYYRYGRVGGDTAGKPI